MAVHGLFRMGFFVGFFTIHPMKVGLTFMSTFLFNCVVVLVLSVAVVQYCAWAFGMYAEGTVVHSIFATQVSHLKGFGPLYDLKVFQYMFIAFLCLSVLWFAVRGRSGNKAGAQVL